MRGLISDNAIWENIALEAFGIKRSLYQRLNWLAVFLLTARISDSAALLDDIIRNKNDWLIQTSVSGKSLHEKRQYVLQKLEWFLRVNGAQPDDLEREDGSFETACESIGLPRPDHFTITNQDKHDVIIFQIYNKLNVPFLADFRA